MPGIVKIGRTGNSPEKRAAELSASTGVPTPFCVEWFAFVSNSEETEASIHNELSSHRVNNGREFFKIEINNAKTACEGLCGGHDNVHYSKAPYDRKRYIEEKQREKIEESRKINLQEKINNKKELEQKIKYASNRLEALNKEFDDSLSSGPGCLFQIVCAVAFLVVFWMDEIFPSVKANRDIQLWSFFIVPAVIYFIYKNMYNTTTPDEHVAKIEEAKRYHDKLQYELQNLNKSIR